MTFEDRYEKEVLRGKNGDQTLLDDLITHLNNILIENGNIPVLSETNDNMCWEFNRLKLPVVKYGAVIFEG
jgi:hypothetical protein